VNAAEGIIVYGIALSDTVQYPWGSLVFEEWFAKTEGIACSAYRDKRDFWVMARTVFSACPVRLIFHGTEKKRLCVLAAVDSFVYALGESPKEIKAEAFSRNKRRKWREDLRVFCEKYGVPFEEPKLLLCARG